MRAQWVCSRERRIALYKRSLINQKLLHVYTPSRTLRSSPDTCIMKNQQYKRKIHGFRTFSCFGPCDLLKPNRKPSSSHSISAPANINTQFLLVRVCVFPYKTLAPCFILLSCWCFIVNCSACFYVNDEPESKFLYTETIKLYCM